MLSGGRDGAGALVLVVLVGLAAPARAERIVAVAPLSVLGAEDTSPATRKLTGQIEAAVAGLADTRVVSSLQVAEAIRKAKKPQLRACEGEPRCLADLGRLVGAHIVIAGEVGGLGEAKVIYLGATDVGTARELRSTTLAVGARRDAGDGGPDGAVIRLLAPDSYRGALRFAVDVDGATIYVDGARVAPSAGREVSLPVGTHAVRVTHPEYRDFVRFIDVHYARTAAVAVDMQQYPIVQRDVLGKPINRDLVIRRDPPLWRRWYVVGPAALGVAIASGMIASALVNRLPDAPCRQVGGKPC